MKQKALRLLGIFMLCLGALTAVAQQKKAMWLCVSDDEVATISFDRNNITRDQRGNYIVWVKTEFHSAEWQRYMTRAAHSKTRVVSTKTKAVYCDIFSDALVRDVYCYDCNSRQVAHRNEVSRGWAPVNASDPVGIVGEFLSDNIRRVLSGYFDEE